MVERRRAVALARHYRESEGLSIAEIASRLGRARATIKAYFYDPTGDKARAVKARYLGVCRGCGAYTQPRNGKAASVARNPSSDGSMSGSSLGGRTRALYLKRESAMSQPSFSARYRTAMAECGGRSPIESGVPGRLADHECRYGRLPGDCTPPVRLLA